MEMKIKKGMPPYQLKNAILRMQVDVLRERQSINAIFFRNTKKYSRK